MKRYVIYFAISFAASFLPFGSDIKSQVLDTSCNKVVLPSSNIDSCHGNESYYIDSHELLIFLERTFGSFLTTLAMYVLHRKYPKIFPTRRVSDYLPDRFRRQKKQ